MTSPAAERGWIPGTTEFGARLALIRQAMGWGNVQEAAVACVAADQGQTHTVTL